MFVLAGARWGNHAFQLAMLNNLFCLLIWHSALLTTVKYNSGKMNKLQNSKTIVIFVHCMKTRCSCHLESNFWNTHSSIQINSKTVCVKGKYLCIEASLGEYFKMLSCFVSEKHLFEDRTTISERISATNYWSESRKLAVGRVN